MITFNKKSNSPLTYLINIEKSLDATYEVRGVQNSLNFAENSVMIKVLLEKISEAPSKLNFSLSQVLDGLDEQQVIIFSIFIEDDSGNIITYEESATHIERPLIEKFSGGEHMEAMKEIVSMRDEVKVEINLPNKNIIYTEIEILLHAVDQFMNEIGFELKAEEKPIYGSFFKKLIYLVKSEKSKNEVKDLYEQGKGALRANFINLPTAEATEKLTIAASNLITALENQEQAVIRLGALLLVKVTMNNKPLIIVETISLEIMEELNKNASILRNPEAVYKLLKGGQIEEAE